MKYIDAEKLIAEIERLAKTYQDSIWRTVKGETAKDFRDKLLSFITSLQQEQPIKVYRVENEKEQKGLWRKFDGTWEPLFDMLTDGQCKDMPMEDSPIYREGGKQWFASAPSKETLQKWFSRRDLEELTAKGFTISEFEVVGHKKISDFEYIFTRDSIISRTYLKVSDIYPQEQPDNEEKIINFFDAVGDCGFSQHDILLLKNIWKEAGCPHPKFQVADASKMEQSEVDLIEETITKEFHIINDRCFNEGIEGWQKEKLIARHFYELGLNAGKEE